MNSGCRDACALAWRLEAIMSGIAGKELLNTYTSERLGHVEQVTVSSNLVINIFFYLNTNTDFEFSFLAFSCFTW